MRSPEQVRADVRKERKEKDDYLARRLRGLDEDAFAEAYQLELDHLEFLKSTKRHKGRIARQERICEVFANVAAEEA